MANELIKTNKPLKNIEDAITETNSAAIAASTAAAATEVTAAIIAGDTTSIDGKITACNTGAVVVASGAITETNSAAIAASTAASATEVTAAITAGDTTSIDGKITACNTGAVVVAAHPNHWSFSQFSYSAQTNFELKEAPGVGFKLYITDIMISNGATAGEIRLTAGAGGIAKYRIYPAINGGVNSNFRTPMVLPDNTALCITSETVTTHTVTINGYTAP